METAVKGKMFIRNSRRWAVIGLASAALVGAAYSSATPAPGHSDPAATAREFVEIVNGAAPNPELLCVAERELSEEAEPEAVEEAPTETEKITATLGAVDVKGDEGTFAVDISSNGDKDTAKYRLVKENGDWKVCGTAE